MDYTALLLSLLPVLAPVAIWGVKALVPKIPKPILPALAPIVGAGIEIAALYAGAPGPDGMPAGVLGALLGAVGLVLREVYNEIKKLSA